MEQKRDSSIKEEKKKISSRGKYIYVKHALDSEEEEPVRIRKNHVHLSEYLMNETKSSNERNEEKEDRVIIVNFGEKECFKMAIACLKGLVDKKSMIYNMHNSLLRDEKEIGPCDEIESHKLETFLYKKNFLLAGSNDEIRIKQILSLIEMTHFLGIGAVHTLLVKLFLILIKGKEPDLLLRYFSIDDLQVV
jgi:hypothetical protein